MVEVPRMALERLAREQGVSLAALSRLLDRNVAYLQQYVRRGSPRVLPERERARLADFLGVSEHMLGREGGGDEDEVEVAVPYLDVAAAAGAGLAPRSERVRRHERFARTMLTRIGVRTADASVIDVVGDSMMPTLLDGDRVLVDRSATRVPPGGGVFVVRVGDELSVKRVLVQGSIARILSDNPTHAVRDVAAADVVVVGRARLLLRGL